MGDAAAYTVAAHGLKGSSATVGAARMAEICKRMEQKRASRLSRWSRATAGRARARVGPCEHLLSPSRRAYAGMITVLLSPGDLAGDASGGAVDRGSPCSVEIDGTAYRHLFRARRLESGSRLRAVDGKGRARWAEVTRVERRRATLSLGDSAPANEPGYRLDLWVAALRSERASWLVEKATELGVYAIRFVATERTPRKYSVAGLERLHRVARAAVEQCHRSRVPEISSVEPWDALIAALAEARSEGADRYLLDLAARRWANDPEPQSQGRWGMVLVGPEGGWSRPEREELEGLDCLPVSLGHRTLRVETAAVAAAVKLLC